MHKILTKTLFAAKKVIYLPSCHSTNTIAADLLRNTTVTEGTLVITTQQTAGKGQRGNRWESATGKNLTFSLILKPTFLTVSEQYYLNMAIALGLYQGILNLGFSKSTAIKWPNDIFIGKQKVAGVLIENIIKSTSLKTAIVGIGFNVNQEKFAIDTATSLKLISGHNFELEQVLETLLLAIEANYLKLKQGAFSELHAHYVKCLFGKGMMLKYLADNEEFYARVISVDKQGKLHLEDDAGNLRLYGFKEVALLRS